ncbi:MAG: VWA domain-containing protein [Thermoplasmatota archaeon]
MTYSAEISRGNPSAFLFLIDQSGSMADPIGEGAKSKAEALSDAINRLLQNLVLKCAKSEGIRDYYYVGVIGYGGHGTRVGFDGPLAGQELVAVSALADAPVRVEDRVRKVPDGAGGLVDQPFKFPVWFDPQAIGKTPMCEALERASGILHGWLANQPDSFPPVVVNITDGESTDGDPSKAFQSLRDLASNDGNVLLFNLHLSGSSAARAVVFPDAPEALHDTFARTLFQGSSTLTPFMVSVAREQGISASERSRGFVLNADLTHIIQALEVGTRPSNLR